MNKERKRLIRNIHNNITECLIEDKVTILNKIAPHIQMEDLNEEGLGIRILYKFIKTNLLEEIDRMIEEFSKKTDLDLSTSD